MTDARMSAAFEQTSWLIEQIKQGDRDSLERLFERYVPIVRSIVAQRLAIRASQLVDREEILQESLLSALNSIEQFTPRSEGAFRAWLATIVTNRVRSSHNAEHAQKRGGGKVRRFSELGSTAFGDHLVPSQAPSPSAAARFGEFEARVEDALLALPARDRQAIELRRLCQMSYAEMAAEMGIAREDTARSVFARALNRLAKELGEDFNAASP